MGYRRLDGSPQARNRIKEQAGGIAVASHRAALAARFMAGAVVLTVPVKQLVVKVAYATLNFGYQLIA